MPINTPSSWLNHRYLQIIKGIGKTPGDTYSAEPDPVVINLLSGVYTLAQDGWSPNIPATKGGGVWADSPIEDGRTLLAAAVGNVTESMAINITAGGYLETMQALAALNKMVGDCRDFWQTEAQVDPVYLAWWAGCGVGLQYALICNIEMKPEYIDAPNPTIRATLSIEREQYWRAIPPGANPKIWTYYVNASHPQYNINTADLITGTDHLITGTVSNKFEWTPAAVGAQVTPLSQNYIDISASQVPGDAPALLELSVQENGTAMQDLYVAVSTHKTSGVNHLGVNVANAYNLAAGDGDMFNGATKNAVVVGTGLLSNNSAATYYQVQKALALGDTTYSTYIMWGGGGAILRLDRHFYGGSFAVFLRAKAGTDDTTQKARVTFTEYDGFGSNASVEFTDIQLLNLGAGTVFYPHFVGIVTLPLTAPETVGLKGYGTFIRETQDGLFVEVALKNSSGAARTTTILDLIMIPIDTAMVHIYNQFGSRYSIMDNTGYLAHGKPDAIAQAVYNASSLIGTSAELMGNAPCLMPRINQRLYFLSSDYAVTDNSPPNTTMTIRANIVPRYSGIRTD